MVQGVRLFKNGSECIVGSVCDDPERQELVRKNKDWGGCKGLYQCGKHILLWCVSVKESVFLGKACKEVNNAKIVLYKTLIKVAETEKELDLFQRFQEQASQ